VRTAYLVVFIDVELNPPAVIGAGIYSERSPTVRWHLVPMVLSEVVADDYQAAHNRMIEMIGSLDDWHPWAKLLSHTAPLHHGDGRPRFVVNREGEMAALQKRMVELDAEMGAPQGKQAPGQGV
jgi:hypothetical protein